MMCARGIFLTGIILLAAVAPATTAVTAHDGHAYEGTHVAFEADNHAVLDYSVNGRTVMESVRVQSQSEVDSSLGVGADASASAVTDLEGAAVFVDASARTSATVDVASGATVTAHDNGHGSLVVTADDEAQYVEVGLGGDASAEQSSDGRLVVTTADGTEQAYVVAGEGEVSMNDEGNVTAAVEQGSRLVVRSYTAGRTSDDDEQEAMIADGTAAASVYLVQDGGETVTDTVDYGRETAVEVSERSRDRVEMTVSRSASEGKVVIVSASEAALEAAEDVQVTVDGEAAAEASSYAELRQAADGGSNSRYMVTQSSSAEAAADVAIAINHFSERSVTMESGSDTATETATESDGSSPTESGETESTTGHEASTDHGDEHHDAESPTSESGPGFGIPAALAALAGLAGIRSRSGN